MERWCLAQEGDGLEWARYRRGADEGLDPRWEVLASTSLLRRHSVSAFRSRSMRSVNHPSPAPSLPNGVSCMVTSVPVTVGASSNRMSAWPRSLALGLNAAGGNLGVAVAQLLVPLVIIVGIPAAAVRLPQHDVNLAYAGLVWMPFIVLVSMLAWRHMDSLTQAKADKRSYVTAMKTGQTWIMSFLYIGTFGSFIGFSFALPLVIKNTFPEFLAGHPFIATYLAGLSFVGALIGSISRPLGGWLSDKMGGARVTLWVFLGMAVFTATAAVGVQQRSFGLFFGSYMLIFLLAGMGNAPPTR